MNELNTTAVTEAIDQYDNAFNKGLDTIKANQDRFIESMNESLDNHSSNPERIEAISTHSIERAYKSATENHNEHLLKLYVLLGKQAVQDDPELAKFVMDGCQGNIDAIVARLKKILTCSQDYIAQLEKLRERVTELLGE